MCVTKCFILSVVSLGDLKSSVYSLTYNFFSSLFTAVFSFILSSFISFIFSLFQEVYIFVVKTKTSLPLTTTS